MSDACEHDWRRGPSDPLLRFHATVCAVCAALGMGRDWQMPEPSPAETLHIMSLMPPRTWPTRPTLRHRFGRWRQSQRMRLASLVAGFDVNA